MRVLVHTVDLHHALNAVRGHVPPAKAMPELARIRVLLTGDELELTTTNGTTAALAVVPVLENEDGTTGEALDLEVSDVTEICVLFPADKDAAERGDAVRIHAADKELVITDVSGLFPGKQVTFPRAFGALTTGDGDSFPNIRKMLLTAHRAPTGLLPALATGAALALFEKAGRAYGERLLVDLSASGSGKQMLLVTCGPRFMGCLALVPDLDDLAQEWADAWTARLAGADDEREDQP